MSLLFYIVVGILLMYVIDFYFIVYKLKKKYKRPYKRIIQMIDKRMAKNYGRVKR